MTTWLRATAFAALLAAVFAASFVAGGAVDVDAGRADEEPETAGHGGDGHGDDAPEADPVRGLAVAADGLRLELVEADLEAGRPGALAFRVRRENGSVLRAFEIEHEKRMHLIVVRRDGAQFQHLHPVMDRDGVWRQRVRLGAPGSYRVFADFTTSGRARTLAADVHADGPADYRALPAPATTATTTTGYDVRLDADGETLRFEISRDGEPVEVEPYLGAGGHLVSLREGDLAYIHTHPADEAGGIGAAVVAFETTFPSAGRYRLYLQFKHRGQVHTAEFTRRIRR